MTPPALSHLLPSPWTCLPKSLDLSEPYFLYLHLKQGLCVVARDQGKAFSSCHLMLTSASQTPPTSFSPVLFTAPDATTKGATRSVRHEGARWPAPARPCACVTSGRSRQPGTRNRELQAGRRAERGARPGRAAARCTREGPEAPQSSSLERGPRHPCRVHARLPRPSPCPPHPTDAGAPARRARSTQDLPPRFLGALPAGPEGASGRAAGGRPGGTSEVAERFPPALALPART